MTADGGSWWDFDEEEQPVPLTAEAEAVLDAADDVVASAREALSREITQPVPVRLPAPTARDISAVAIGLLLIGCVAMFVIGWWQGGLIHSAVGTADARPQLVARATLANPPLIFPDGFDSTREEVTPLLKEEV